MMAFLQKLAASLKRGRTAELPKDNKEAFYILMPMVIADQYRSVADLLSSSHYPASFQCGRAERSLLHIAANCGNYECLCLLLKRGAFVNLQDRSGCTPLHLAAKNGQRKCLNKLLEHDCDTNLRNNEGLTAIHWLAVNGRTELLQDLLSRIKDVDIEDAQGQTPLHVACQNGHLNTALCLLGSGAQVNKANTSGWTPLHFACRHGQHDAVDILLKRGAEFRAEKGGKTPLTLSLEEGYGETCEVLLKRWPRLFDSMISAVCDCTLLEKNVMKVLQHLCAQDWRLKEKLMESLAEHISVLGHHLLSGASEESVHASSLIRAVHILLQAEKIRQVRQSSASPELPKAQTKQLQHPAICDRPSLLTLWQLLDDWMVLLGREGGHQQTSSSSAQQDSNPVDTNTAVHRTSPSSSANGTATAQSSIPSSESSTQTSTQCHKNNSTESPEKVSADVSIKTSTDSSIKSPTDSSIKTPTDSAQKISTDSSIKTPTDSAQKTSIDSSKKAQTDASQKSLTDSSIKAPTNSSQKSHTDSPNFPCPNGSSQTSAQPVTSFKNSVLVSAAKDCDIKDQGDCQCVGPNADVKVNGSVKEAMGSCPDRGKESVPCSSSCPRDQLPSVPRMCALIQAFYLCTQINRKSRTGTQSKFFAFLQKHVITLKNFVQRDPQLIFNHFHFLLSCPEYMTSFLPIIHAQSFESRRQWFYDNLPTPGTWNLGEEEQATVKISREQLFRTSCEELLQRPPDMLKSMLSVQFSGEAGLGQGLVREWFDLLSKEILNPDYALFTVSADGCTFQPNSNSAINPDHLSYFRFAGRLLGLALFHRQLLSAYFTRSFYKHILGVPVNYEDVASIDPEYAKSLQWLLDHDISDLGLDLTFSIETDVFGAMQEVELLPGGSRMAVTQRNKAHYVQLVTELRMTRAIKPQIDSFLSGFHDYIPRSLVQLFNQYELELLLSGLPEIDLADWKSNTNYTGCSEDNTVVQWFWNFVEKMSEQQRVQLLQFVTGSSRVPYGGFSHLSSGGSVQPFTISCLSCPETQPYPLPTASTCINLLRVPEYPSQSVLEDRLLTALRCGGQGYGMP